MILGFCIAQCSGQDKKPLSDFRSGKEFSAMLKSKNNDEKNRILKAESQLADSTLQLMKSFRGDDAVIFETPKDDDIKEARNIEKIFEEQQVRNALQNGLSNLKIKNTTDKKTGKTDFTIDYSGFGWNDSDMQMFLMDRTTLDIKKISWDGKITEKSARKNSPIDSALVVAKIRVPTVFERMETEPSASESLYDNQWKIETSKTDDYTIAVTFPKVLEDRLLYVQAETKDKKRMDPGAITAVPITDFNKETLQAVENIVNLLKQAKLDALKPLNHISENDMAQYKKVRQLVAYAENSNQKNKDNPEFDLMEAVIKKGEEMQLLSENKRIIYARFPAELQKTILIFGKHDKEMVGERWIK